MVITHQLLNQSFDSSIDHFNFGKPTWVRHLSVGIITAAVLFVAGAITALANEGDEREGTFAVISLNYETNATDGDVGIQAFFDADGLKEVAIEDPNDIKIFEVDIGSGLRKVGFTELFFEGMEPLITELVPDDERSEARFTLEEIFNLFPAGEYKFEGKTVDGDELEGTAVLTKVLPAGPVIVAPQEDEQIPAGKALVIDWDPVTETIVPNLGPLRVSGYKAIVANEDVMAEFTIDLPPDMTEVMVPAAFLTPETEFSFEIIVVEVSGNQTVTESTFVTSK